MRGQPLRTLGLTAAGLLILPGCSSSTDSSPASSPASPATSAGPTTSANGPATTTATVAPGDVGVSSDGVTTAVGAPAESTEDDYYQACRAAKVWMDQQGGDRRDQIEPYLKTVQNAESSGPATFGIPWTELSPGQQSAVIVAVQAAVDGLCE